MLELLVVEEETFDQIVAKLLCGANAKLNATVGFYAIAEGDNDVERAVIDLVVFAVGGGYPEFPDN